MISPHQDFQQICEAPHAATAVRELNEPRLARLIHWLRAHSNNGTIRTLIQGLAELEAADRFTRAHTK